MNKFIFYHPNNNLIERMFSDILLREEAMSVSSPYYFSNPIEKVLNNIHMSKRLSQTIELPFKFIWNKYNVLEKIYNNSDTFVLIFTPASFSKMYLPYITEIKKRSNVKIIYIILDTCIGRHKFNVELTKKEYFDLIYSFEKDDCDKYNFRYSNAFYSKSNDIEVVNYASDLFFIGRAKNRLSLILEIAKKANLDGLNIEFLMLGVDKEKQVEIKGVRYIDKYLEYTYILQRITGTKCILDIVQEGQFGLSVRPYEAIFYNKYLITNNKNIKVFQYYNDDLMKIIDDNNLINFEFIKTSKEPNYFYANEYSPLNLLKDIEKILEI